MSELATVELGIREIVYLFVMAVSIATNIVGIWMLRHNIPDLHAKHLDLLARVSALDKDKLTREMHPPQAMTGPQPGQWPAVTEPEEKGPSKP